MSAIFMDHVALLVRSIEDAVGGLGLDCDLEAIEEFPCEGTRELYLGADGAPARLLLMQPIGPGPYARALEKRGPGLHHVAFRVPDLHQFAGSISGTGWLLHPESIALLKPNRQVWLCRPGVQMLVEVSVGTPEYTGDPVVDQVSVVTGKAQRSLVDVLSLQGLDHHAGTHSSVRIRGRHVPLTAEVLNGGEPADRQE